MDVLIVTPMQEELDGLVAGCSEAGYAAENIGLGRLPAVCIPALGVTGARGGTGKAQFAAQTQHLLDAGANWELVICAGAAGALDDALAVGDVVVATATIEHDYRNRFTQAPLPRFESALTALNGLRQAANRLRTNHVHFGPVASGDEDIIDDFRRRELLEQTGALAVAWEGAGGARACTFSGVPFLEIRGITDAANQHAPADFEKNLALAMRSVAALVVAWRDDTRLYAAAAGTQPASEPVECRGRSKSAQLRPFGCAA
jgi:adenosylhomocysteine nucleosidase